MRSSKISGDLERALREHPDDADVALVFADAVGGERGEHIVLASLAAPTVEQQRRERELRRAAEIEMFEASKRDARNGMARITWRGGFVERLDVDLRGDRALERLTALLERPEMLRLRAIDLRPGWYVRDPAIDLETIAALVEKFPLRTFGAGALGQPLDVAALPRVPGLALSGTGIDVAKLPEVVELELAGNDFPAFGEATIEALAMRPLERLVLYGAPNADTLARFAKIFDGGMPSLKSFGLMGGDDAFNDAFLQKLESSKLFAQLDAIGFTANRDTESNRWLIVCKEKFAKHRFFTGFRWESGWASAWHDMAHLYEALGRADEALAEFEALVTFDDDATYWADVGMQLQALKRNDEALVSYDHALAKDPKNHRAWSGRACVLEDREDFAGAIAAWDAGLAAGLADVHTFTHRAWTLMRLDRNDEAIAMIDEALKLQPDHAWSLTERKRLTGIVATAKRKLRSLLGR